MPQIIFTIDTEIGELAKERPDGFDIFIEGKVNGEIVGYDLIQKTLREYGVTGEFFVDVYPYKKVGEDKYARLCTRILKAGHQVELHTHPSTAFDSRRPFMWQYSLAEQKEIIKFGVMALDKWTGRKPVAHRAGGYGLDINTLRALSDAGIDYDLSFLPGNRNSKLENETLNQPFRFEKVWEIPVTVYRRIIEQQFLGVTGKRVVYLQKLDFRYGAPLAHIRGAVNTASDNQIIVLFLHSFNFLDIAYNLKSRSFTRINVDHRLIHEFKSLLAWLADIPRCRFTTIANAQLSDDETTMSNQIIEKHSIVRTAPARLLSKINPIIRV